MEQIKKQDKVKVRSGNELFDGIVEKIERDFDQWIYFVDGQWYCQSEVELITKKLNK